MPNVTLDISYLYGTWKKTASDTYTPSGADERISATKILIGLSFTF